MVGIINFQCLQLETFYAAEAANCSAPKWFQVQLQSAFNFCVVYLLSDSSCVDIYVAFTKHIVCVANVAFFSRKNSLHQVYVCVLFF